MTHLGVYYAPEHSRQADRDYIAALQPPVIRILDPDVQHIADMHALCPNAIIAPRMWAIDDNNGAAVRDLMANPDGTGRRHADQYRAQIIEWFSQASQRGLTMPPSDRFMFNAANEPNQGGTPDKIAAYNIAFLNQCKINGIRAAALCLGVGWPDNTGPDTPVDWTPYTELEQAIKRGSHWLELHEYHYKTGPQDGWRWLAGRHLQCPFDVPILLGEIGIDNYVDKARWDKEGGNRGWQGNVSPDVYAEMIEAHIRRSDKRVVAGLIFITDYRSNAWQSFDTAPAHNALLSRKDRMIPQAAPPSTPPALPPGSPLGPQPTPPVDVLLPFVPRSGVEQPVTPQYAIAPNGAYIRKKPVKGEIIAAVPYGKQVDVKGYEHAYGAPRWAYVQYGDMIGYIRSDLLGDEPPQPTPAPPQPAPVATNLIEPRVAQAILKIESGGRTHGEDGRITARFEAHIFKTYLKNDALWAQHFRTDAARPWVDQMWRRSPNDTWQPIHTGRQADEYAVFEFAISLNREAAYQSISMGSPQVVGFNHAKIGYPSAAHMFTSFQDGQMQTIGFINFCLATPGLLEAMRTKDWERVATLYNGSGNTAVYSKLLRQAYLDLGD